MNLRLSPLVTAACAAFCLIGPGAPALHAGGQDEAPPPPRLRVATVVRASESYAPYEAVVTGARRAVNERERIALEEHSAAGPGELTERIARLAASGDVDVIITAGQTGARAAVSAGGDVRFLVLDAVVMGDDRVHSIGINHRETAFLAGHTVGLLFEDRPEAGVSLVIADTGTLLEELIRPAFALGVHSLAPSVGIGSVYLRPDFPAETVAQIISERQSDAFLVLGSGEVDGLPAAVRSHPGAVLWLDRYGAGLPDSRTLVSATLDLESLAHRGAARAIDGSLAYGSPEIVRLADDSMTFTLNERQLPGARREEIARRVGEMKSRMEGGEIDLAMPQQLIVRPLR
jgi:basic membrane lipoprotein Med (substrate-binding protein (PBP1-ABC) superfamily)